LSANVIQCRTYAPAIRRQPVALAEQVFVVFVLILSTGAFTNLSANTMLETAESAGGLFGMQLLWMLINTITLTLLFTKCRSSWKELRKERLLIALIGLVMLSSIWSVAPGISARRGMAVMGTTLFAVYLARRFTLREFLNLFAITCGIVAVSSLVFGIFSLGYAIGAGDGTWHGVFNTKNVLGRQMALNILVFIFVGKVSPHLRSTMWALEAVSLLLLVLSRSGTAIATLAALPVFFIAARLLRKKGVGLALFGGFACVLCLIGVYVFQHFDEILAMFGKSADLTGRLPLWIAATFVGSSRPILGFGYNAFWQGANGPSLQVWKIVGWPAPHGHNGFLDIWLDLGLVGLTLFLIGFATYVRRALKYLRQVQTPAAAWPFVMMCFMFLTNLTESSFLKRNTIWWILYVVTILYSKVGQGDVLSLPRRVVRRVREAQPPARMETGS
jgi:exopolysaccharide production protein ExoQ